MDFAFADVSTMLVMITLSSLVMAAGMAAVGWGHRDDGVRWWVQGLLLNAVAHLLFALRGKVPDVLSVVVGNTLLTGVYLALLSAVLQFQGRGPLRPSVLGLPLLMAGSMALLADNYSACVVVASLLLCGLNLWMISHLLMRWRMSSGGGAWLLTGALVLQTLVLTLRVALIGVGSLTSTSLMQPSALQTLTFMTSFAVVLLASMGFVFMVRDRADEGHRRMAAVDPLTGVANRRATIAALDRDVARAIRTREPISVMMIDIDHFKRINHRYGHPAGDRMLCSVVEVLRERLRSQDLVGRYGGKEFLVVLPDTPLKGAYQLALELCEAVEAHGFIHEGQEVPLTVSIGVFGGILLPGDHWDMLIYAADRALSDAKTQGRNRVEVNEGLRRPNSALAAQTGPETHPTLF